MCQHYQCSLQRWSSLLQFGTYTTSRLKDEFVQQYEKDQTQLSQHLIFVQVIGRWESI
jgi:hypothetical protein